MRDLTHLLTTNLWGNFMASLNNKEFNSTVEKLEKMADGTKLHSAETSFPATITEAGLREDKTALENAREEYEQAENAARVKFDAYEAVLKSISSSYSNYATQLYGFYGKKNQVIADFGLEPYKTGGKKGPRTNTGTQTTTA